jgi:hypothetical protein
MNSNDAEDAGCSGALLLKDISLQKGLGYSMQADHSTILGSFLIGVGGVCMTVSSLTLRVQLRVKQSCPKISST